MKSTILKIMALASLIVVPFAHASADECTSRDQFDTHIAAVKDAVWSATFTGRNAEKDRMGMDAKAEAARVKMAEMKFGDAIDKLDDLIEKADALESAPKAKLVDATDIVEAAAEAIYCVSDLMN